MRRRSARLGECLQHQRIGSLRSSLLAGLAIVALVACSSDSKETSPAVVTTPVADAGAVPVDAPTTNKPECDPFEPRSGVVELVVGPTGLEKTLLAAIDSAKTSLDLEVGELEGKPVLQALVSAKARGVVIRIVLDAAHAGDAKGALGADVVHEPRAELVAHARVMVIDARRALVGSSTLGTASVGSERTFSTFVDDAGDVAQLRKLVEHDWNASPGSPTFECTRLLLSPANARERLTTLVSSAEERLDLELGEATDDKLLAAIGALATGGVKVRALLADPVAVTSNVTTAARLKKAGVEVRFFRKLPLRSTLVISERAALIGSHTLTTASVDTHREVSLLVANDEAREAASAAFETDWAAGTLN